MTMRFLSLTRHRRDGTEDVTQFHPGLTVIYGAKNTSKTTTLEIIDFCLGNDSTATDALGDAVVAEYCAFDLRVRVGNSEHLVRRVIDAGLGHLTKVHIDGAGVEPRDFQRWVFDRLGWSEFEIPKGRVPKLARETIPLTFRALLRHAYRKEDSWVEFAAKEEEFVRRAVLAFSLGLEGWWDRTDEFLAGDARRRALEIEAQLKEIALNSRAVRDRLLRDLSAGGVSANETQSIRTVLVARIRQLEARRGEISRSLKASPEFDTALGEEYRDVDRACRDLSGKKAELTALVVEYSESRKYAQADQARLDRASSSIEMLGAVHVQACPECMQTVEVPSEDADATVCFLCHRARPSSNQRERRVAVERSILESEIRELTEVVERTQSELARIDEGLARAVTRRQQLGHLLDARRAKLLAPFMQELEEVSRQRGVLEGAIKALEALNYLSEREDRLRHDAKRAHDEADSAEQRAAGVRALLAHAENRCGEFAETINDFMDFAFREEWHYGAVSLLAEEMTFFIRGARWQAALGAEAKVLFFLSYHAAMLALSKDPDAHALGFVLLDNPIQQGLNDDTVARCLTAYAALAERSGGQLIVTLPRRLPIESAGSYSEIEMSREYGAG